MPADAELVFSVPDNIEEILEHGGVDELPEGSLVQFGPDSDFLWSISTTANAAHVLAAGAMELGQPVISSAVEDHSLRDTWRRLDSSARMIGAIATDDDAVRAGRKIRDIHERLNIGGTDEKGVWRAATEPDVYALGWLPIVWIMEQSMLDSGADEQRMERWYQETRIAYQCQDVDDEYVPKDYASYRERIKDIMASAQRTSSLDRLEEGGVEGPHRIPDALWRGPLKVAGDKTARMMMVGGAPAELLDAVGIQRPGKLEQSTYRAVRTALNLMAQKGPKQLRHHPELVSAIHPVRHRRDKAFNTLGRWANRQVVG